MNLRRDNRIKKRRTRGTYIEYLILNVLVLIGLTLIHKLYNTNIFKYPLKYSGDALQTIYGNRLLADTWLFGYSNRISFPYYAYMSDFPNSGLYINTIRAVVFQLIDNEAFAINLLYIVGYLLAASAAYWSLRKLEVSKMIAGAVAILFTFLPFHFMRGIAHLTIGTYWPVPVFFYFLINYLKGNKGYEKNQRGFLTKDSLLHVVFLLVLGGHSIYYTYFSCFFVCVTLVLLFIKKEHIEIIKQAAIDLAILLGGVAMTVLVYVINISRYGRNASVAVRSAGEIETYGLKIGQLLMPVTGHRLSFLDDWKTKYNSMPLTSENHMATLGFLFAIGFIFLFIELVKKTHKDEDIFICSTLNVAAVLLATVGGAASIIATFFSQIRCYNRISIFIAFLAAVSFAKLFDKLALRIKNNIVYFITVMAVLALGILDQTTVTYANDYESINAEWDSDQEFVSCIEDMEGEGAEIYQMPYVYYPESGGKHSMESYDLTKGYIHSETLVWSFGAYKGRTGDLWNLYVSSLDLEQQVKVIFAHGFDGIYVDSYGFSKEEFPTVVEELGKYTDFSPIISDNGRLYYFSFCNYELSGTEQDIAQLKNFVQYDKGIYETERNGDDSWNWCQGEAYINVFCANEEEKAYTINMDITTIQMQGDYEIELKLNDEYVSTVCIAAGTTNKINIPVILKPGKNILELDSNIPDINEGGDTRKLAFCIRKFVINGADSRLQEIDCEAGATYTFGIDGNSNQLFITEGISYPEEGYMWTEGHEVEMYCNFGAASEVHCTISQRFQITETQPVEVLVNGKSIFCDTVRNGNDISFVFDNTAGKMACIKLLLPEAVSPFELGMGEDTRELAIAVQSISFVSGPKKSD